MGKGVELILIMTLTESFFFSSYFYLSTIWEHFCHLRSNPWEKKNSDLTLYISNYISQPGKESVGNWRTEGIRRAPQIMRLRKRGKLRGALLLLGWKVIPAPDRQWTRWHAGKKHGEPKCKCKKGRNGVHGETSLRRFLLSTPSKKKKSMWIVANVRRYEMEIPPKQS